MARKKLQRVETRLPPSLVEWIDDLVRFDKVVQSSRSSKIRQILTDRYGSTEMRKKNR